LEEVPIPGDVFITNESSMENALYGINTGRNVLDEYDIRRFYNTAIGLSNGNYPYSHYTLYRRVDKDLGKWVRLRPDQVIFDGDLALNQGDGIELNNPKQRGSRAITPGYSGNLAVDFSGKVFYRWTPDEAEPSKRKLPLNPIHSKPLPLP